MGKNENADFQAESPRNQFLRLNKDAVHIGIKKNLNLLCLYLWACLARDASVLHAAPIMVAHGA